MGFFFIVLIIGFVIFLFRLYHVAKDDAVLVKKNISLQLLFDSAFVTGIFALFTARLFYVILNPDPVFLNPLAFLIFPYFPGLSLLGGIIGGIIALFLYARAKKFPIARVFDFYTDAFSFVLPIGLLGYFLLSGDFSLGGTVRLVLFTLLAISVNLYFQPKARSLELKDGSISALFITFLSLIMLLTNSIDNPGLNSFISNKESLIYTVLLVAGFILFIKQELIGRKDKKNIKKTK
jgi:prolipoprotein diacylglyceryltransferase